MWPGLATRRYVPSMFLHHFGGELRVSHWLSVLGSPSSSSGLMLDGVWRLTLTLSHLGSLGGLGGLLLLIELLDGLDLLL